MIIDTSNAHAAPGPSRGYACLRVAFPSIGRFGVPRLGRRRSLGTFVPLRKDPSRGFSVALSPLVGVSNRWRFLPTLKRRSAPVTHGCAAAGGKTLWLPVPRRPRSFRRWKRILLSASNVSLLSGGPCAGSSTRNTTEPGKGGWLRERGKPHSSLLTFPRRQNSFCLRPQIRRDDPLNLSILLSGGKETNQDSPSSCERRGKSPALNPRPPRAREM